MTVQLLDNNKNPVKEAFVDGYAFGDRLLEGVIFKVSVTKNGKDIKITCVNGGTYFEDLNTKKWLKEAKQYVLDCPDELSSSESCDAIGEVELVGHPKQKGPVTPVIIPMVNIKDIFK